MRLRIRVLDEHGNRLKYVSDAEADGEVEAGRAERQSAACIRMLPLRGRRHIQSPWHIRKSGYGGPGVWQLVTP